MATTKKGSRPLTTFVKRLPKYNDESLDLIEFFTYADDQKLFLFDKTFMEALREATRDDVHAPIIDEKIYVHATNRYSHDGLIMKFVKETVIDMRTPEGRAAARKRFGILAHELSKYLTNGSCELCGSGMSTVLGYLRLKDGSVTVLNVDFYRDDKKWYCRSSIQNNWNKGIHVLSKRCRW